MWDVLAEGMDGYVVLVDLSRPESFEEAAGIIRHFRDLSDAPFVIGANKGSGDPAEIEGLAEADRRRRRPDRHLRRHRSRLGARDAAGAARGRAVRGRQRDDVVSATARGSRRQRPDGVGDRAARQNVQQCARRRCATRCPTCSARSSRASTACRSPTTSTTTTPPASRRWRRPPPASASASSRASASASSTRASCARAAATSSSTAPARGRARDDRLGGREPRPPAPRGAALRDARRARASGGAPCERPPQAGAGARRSAHAAATPRHGTNLPRTTTTTGPPTQERSRQHRRTTQRDPDPAAPQTTYPTRSRPKEATMAKNVDESLSDAMKINGAIGAALVDYTSGMTLGTAGGNGINLDVAAAGNTEVVRAKQAVMKELGIKGGIEDILITLDKQLHIIRMHGHRSRRRPLPLRRAQQGPGEPRDGSPPALGDREAARRLSRQRCERRPRARPPLAQRPLRVSPRRGACSRPTRPRA